MTTSSEHSAGPDEPQCLRNDEGIVDLAIMFPIFIVMLLMVVGLGRLVYAKQLVDQAATAAARAASLASTPAQASTDANTAAQESLSQAGLVCASYHTNVNTTGFGAGGQVSVTVTCTTDLSKLSVSGVPGHLTLTGKAQEPLETNRDFGG